MNSHKLLKFASYFEALAAAEAEELPENSKDLKTILKNIDKLKTFHARKKYAEKNLKHLSSGSSRIVYLTADKTVIKLAKNEKGIAQNKAEINHKIKSKYINKIISSSKDNVWMQTHFLKKITEKQFKKLTDINFNDFGDAIRYEFKKEKSKPDEFDSISETSFFKEIKKIIKENSLATGDIIRISSWGQKDNYPILLDTGLTSKIYKDYYET